ncbi:MAG: ribonuclease III [Anaerolineaceae bacterium]|nr:ribonuclease III [Anaerolineaceae bacterium]MBN2678346.1 ribonuclease III [Anaerolineaceae bacterium]
MEKNVISLEEESPQELRDRLNLPVQDMLLLSRALTHRSYLNEHPEAIEDNERLEFLGDAVLDFVVGAWLYQHFPEMSEGDLTRMRSALVHTERLAEFARQIDLGRAIHLGRGELQAGGRDKDALLCDTFEAVVGAIYLSSGIDAALQFMSPFCRFAADISIAKNSLDDPKSLFQQWAQARGLSTPQYVTRNMSGPDHARIFEVDVLVEGKVYGTGIGRSKQAATKLAAQDALDKLEPVYINGYKMKSNNE